MVIFGCFASSPTQPPANCVRFGTDGRPAARRCVWMAFWAGRTRNVHEFPLGGGVSSKCLWSLISTVPYKRILKRLSSHVHKSLFPRNIPTRAICTPLHFVCVCVCGWAWKGSGHFGCHGYLCAFGLAWLSRVCQKRLRAGRRRGGGVSWKHNGESMWKLCLSCYKLYIIF